MAQGARTTHRAPLRSIEGITPDAISLVDAGPTAEDAAQQPATIKSPRRGPLHPLLLVLAERYPGPVDVTDAGLIVYHHLQR